MCTIQMWCSFKEHLELMLSKCRSNRQYLNRAVTGRSMASISKFTSLISDILSELHLIIFCSSNTFPALAVPCTRSSIQHRRWCNKKIFVWFVLQDNNFSCRCLWLIYSSRWHKPHKWTMKLRKLHIAFLFHFKNYWVEN